MQTKKAPCNSRYTAQKPKTILTLFGIEYDAWDLLSLLFKASVGLVVSYLAIFSVLLWV